MANDFRVVAKYGTPEEAHLIRNRLQAAGIPAFLDGETAAGWGWHFANAMGGVKVLVPDEHAEAAESILAAGDAGPTADAVAEGASQAPARTDLAEEETSPSWRCGNCRAQVDSAMDVCWACGTTREEAEEQDGESIAWEPEEEPSSQAEPEEPAPPSPGVALMIILFPPTFAFFLFTKLCEFLAPWVPDVRHHPSPGAPEGLGLQDAGSSEPGPAASQEAAWEVSGFGQSDGGDPFASDKSDLDDLVLRAWRAALMGFFLMPPVLMTLYSLWLLLRYWTRRHRAHRRRDRRAGWTLVVNIVAVLCLGFLTYLAVGRFSPSTYDRVPNAPGVMGPSEEKREP